MKTVIATEQTQREDAYYVRKEVFVKEQEVPVEIEIDELEDKATHFVIYNDDKKPQAAARLRIIDEGSKAKLERICVLKEARSFGLGHKLLEALESEAIANGAKEAVMHAQVHALPFYEKKGYKVVSEPFEEAGITHVKMTKTLSV
ncbi:putative N-acetyltransferase YjcF [Bacillus safensis]|uniref:GNAT family N-acetyltransferase n=1 Tax=Bacillus safensis TaxID=561879 RepID=UPI0006A8DE50|nr:GNAT family N-acetyltransferase [Bacillus safensis]CUB22925.1 putative N-acetyltransferase YjcF [Bacillus safensis]